jgi:hypothetical protein
MPERILRRLDWHVIRPLDGLLQGDYRSLFYGYGVDFADVREYQPGDDIRYIDWNVTARMNVPHIRQYVQDREITAWFLLDLTPSMDFGTVEAGRAKRTVLVDFVTTLARLLTRHGGRVGALFFGERIERTIPPAGAAADERPAQAPATTPGTHYQSHASPGGGSAHLQAALPGVCHIRFHERTGMGAPAQDLGPTARGSRHPPV